MRNNIIAALCALAFVTLLTGCQLARADGAAAGGGDRLVGVVVTDEYLDLFDWDGYFADHASTILKGGEIVIDDDRYDGRLYAELVSKLHTNEETGEQSQSWEYVFPGLEDSSALYSAMVTSPEGNSHWSGIAGGGIADVEMSMGDSITMEGTVYTLPGSPVSYYVNPVYQSADGTVYLKAGSGYSASGVVSEGSVYITTLSQAETVTENGETTERKDSVTIRIAVKYPAVRVRIVEMGADHMPLRQAEYMPSQLPERVTPDPRAVYLMVETEVETAEGTAVRYVMITREEAGFSVYRPGPNGLCEGVRTEIAW